MQYVCVCICICTILSKSFLVNVCYDQYIGHNRDSETREHHQWHNEDRGEGHGGSRALHTEGMVRVHVFPISPPRRVPLRGPEPVQSMEVEGKAKRHNIASSLNNTSRGSGKCCVSQLHCKALMLYFELFSPVLSLLIAAGSFSFCFVQNKDTSTCSFTPFGGGQRLCPGLDLARLEASIFLHHLVTDFT